MLNKIKRAWTHVLYAPTFYAMKYSLRWAPSHPLAINPVPDVHHWARHGTPTLRLWNHLLWASIIVEVFAVIALIQHILN